MMKFRRWQSEELNCGVVMDLIYRPLQTKLLHIAAQKGIKTVSGAEMFLAQGFAQWELFMGKPAPEAAMRSAVMAKLRAGEFLWRAVKAAGRTRASTLCNFRG